MYTNLYLIVRLFCHSYVQNAHVCLSLNMIVTTITAVFTTNSFRATFLERNKTDNSQAPGKMPPLAKRSRTICSRSSEKTTVCAAILKTGLFRLEWSVGLYRDAFVVSRYIVFVPVRSQAAPSPARINDTRQ